ncbi:MAG: hypothetical protein EZS28_003484 [Streblomastix strix]|uniref:Uncharacterized protein n=1 Tax=Streblomastix strix TaxID=222440 RepID=A0A5J4X1B1_9EUKA|nr:MAG: hypothetical protein EZS28_003484 [Streblomastix strix]
MISREQTQALFDFTTPSSDDFRLWLSERIRFESFFRLFLHPDSKVIGDAVITLYNILVAGSNRTPQNSIHPHFEQIRVIQGIERLFQLFYANKSQFTRDRACLCIALLYRSQRIPNEPLEFNNSKTHKYIDKDAWKVLEGIQMQQSIICHLKSLIKDRNDIWLHNEVVRALVELGQNKSNREEILRDGFRFSQNKL